MRQTKTASPFANAPRVRLIILAALVAAIILIAGQARPALADHGGGFGWDIASTSVSEGEVLALTMVVNGRTPTSPAVNVGINIVRGSAEQDDVQGDDCINIGMGVIGGNQFPVFITTFADADSEDETFSVHVTFSPGDISGCTPSAGPAGHQALASGQTFVDVTIDDTGGGDGDFEFDSTNSTADEGDTVTLNVTRSGDLDGTASVECNVTGGTAESADWDAIDDIANFGDNDSTGSCQFQILADADSTVSETIIVALQNPSNGTVGSPSQHTITIGQGEEDGDFEFATTSSQADEGDVVTLNVVRGGDLDGAASVECNVTGGTGETSDWDPIDDVANFLDNDSTGSCQFQILADGDGDASETLIVTLQNPTNGTIGSPSQHTITIGEDGSFAFTTTSSSADEGDTVTLNVSRSGDLDGAASVECNVTGGTGEGSDWDPIDDVANFSDNDSTGSCQFQILADGDGDASETLIVTLQNPVNGTIGSPSQHTITIGGSEEGFEFTSTSSNADEGDIVTLNVVRGGDLDGAASVECNVTGGTGEGSDWDPIDDIANFSDNDSTGSCQFEILEDGDTDVTETLIVTLENPTNGTIGSPSQHTITIGGSDQLYSFQFATYTVQESAGTVTVTVVRSSNLGAGSVSWDIVGGTATAGVDYVDATGTVTFTAGQTTRTFSITILSTAAVEANETILVTLLNPVNGELGTPDDTVITITEIGVPTVTDVTPGNVPVTGGTVVIAGTNFTGTTAVTFGSVNAVSFVINNTTQITAVAPARPAGNYDVRVTTPAGTSANTVNDDITYGAAESVTYQLSVRWSLIAWLGKNNASISNALQGTVSLSESQAQTAPNNIFSLVTAVATWDNPTQRYLFWFPGGGSVPGANDITQFKYGTPYSIAVTSNVNWTVVEGP